MGYKCGECDKCFMQKTSLVDHMFLLHGREIHFPCKYCGKEFPQVKSRLAHEKRHTPENLKRVQCNICKKVVKITSIKDHLRRHALPGSSKQFKRYQCEECGKYFKQKFNLEEHILAHAGIKNFSCDYCGKEFTHLSNKNRHEKIHQPESSEKVQCDICNNYYKSTTIKDHKKRHILPECSGQVQCHICEKYYSDTFIRIHLKKHSVPKIIKYVAECHICSMPFQSIVKLNNHLRIHEDPESVHQCQDCKQTFSISNNLRRHQRGRCKGLPFVEDVEDKIYIKVPSSEQKLFTCEDCNKTFTFKNALTRHQKLQRCQKILLDID